MAHSVCFFIIAWGISLAIDSAPSALSETQDFRKLYIAPQQVRYVLLNHALQSKISSLLDFFDVKLSS